MNSFSHSGEELGMRLGVLGSHSGEGLGMRLGVLGSHSGEELGMRLGRESLVLETRSGMHGVKISRALVEADAVVLLLCPGTFD